MYYSTLSKSSLNYLKIAKFSLLRFFATKLQKITVLLISLFLCLCFLSANLGLYVNSSDSLQPGLYLRADLVNFLTNNLPVKQKYQIGEIVAFCPPNTKIFQQAKKRNYINAGFCPGNLGIMLKQVVAINGDVITINQNGVWVNGKLLDFSKPLIIDGLNRKMQIINVENYQLKNNEILVMTNINPYSFDSRYFGVINTKQIKHKIKLGLSP